MMQINRTIIREFAYRPSPQKSVGILLLASCGIALIGYLSFNFEGGAEIGGLQLTERQMRWFFRVICFLSPIGLVEQVSVVYFAFFRHRRIALTDDSVILPKQRRIFQSSEEIEIRFADITNISIRILAFPVRILRIEHKGGVVAIPIERLPSRKAFEEVSAAIQTAFDDFRRTHSGSPQRLADDANLGGGSE
jgi:hypothetical protein